jgi:hypothetical protein
MSLLQHIEQWLRGAGYRVQLSIDNPSMLYFEDYSLFGFAAVYESVDLLLRNWKDKQDVFLQANAPFLRSAPQKAWNCYTVHLTDATATAIESQRLFDIEENFVSTRKIARANMATAVDVQRALYPLIPVQNLLKMQGSHGDIDIAQRFHDWPEAAVKALLGDGKAEDIVELLLEAE